MHAERAARFAAEMSSELGVAVTVARALPDITRETNVWITCTPARRWFLGRDHVAPGAFIAAVGADHPEKQEIEPELLAASVVIADCIAQCAAMGELHHALDAGVMRREDVRAKLADIVAGIATGRKQRLNVVKIDETAVAKKKKSGGKIKMRDIVIFTRQFSTMINAGLPLVQALDILAKQSENPALKDVTNAAVFDVESGHTVADALGKFRHPGPALRRPPLRHLVDRLAAIDVGVVSAFLPMLFSKGHHDRRRTATSLLRQANAPIPRALLPRFCLGPVEDISSPYWASMGVK